MFGTTPINYKQPEEKTCKQTVYFTMDDNTTKKKNVFTFDGESGDIEHYCQMRSDFTTTMREFEFETGALHFEYFPKFLASTAGLLWEAMMQQRNLAHNNINHFKSAEQAWLVANYVSEDSRDAMQEYLQGPECRKKHDADVRTHAARILLMFHYHDKFPGTTVLLADPTSAESLRLRKKIFFETFPLSWQQSFILSRGNITKTENMSLR